MSCLTFLGLAEKAGKLQIGEESCGIAARAKKAKVLLTATDASRNSVVRAGNYSKTANAPHVVLPYTKDEIGAIVGRGSPGMLAITDIGMAAAFVKKLSAECGGEFDEVAAQLDAAAARALQRKKEKQQHKDNLRRGKKK
jgi:ribosomal protein L7Ae-like RNA K-turn-binding protein